MTPVADVSVDGTEMSLRWYRPEERNYVLATWLRSANDRMPKGHSVYDIARPLVEYIVDHGQVLVMCDDEKPGVICGWTASIHGRTAWVYVLHALRGRGIGRCLLRAAREVAEGTGEW